MREAELTRETKETNITVKINLDGNGDAEIKTGIGFFDHMLTALSVHSGIDIDIKCDGDLEVDDHHTIEDVGITLGQAFDKALGDKKGIARYGFFALPMDEALATCALDIGGRAYLVFDAEFRSEKIGEMDSQMVIEFFRAFAYNSSITLHLNLEYGENDHHKCEALFKAFAHALRIAVKIESDEVLSSKGAVDYSNGAID